MGFLDRLLGRSKETTEDVMGEAKEAGQGAQEQAGDMMGEAKQAGEGMQEQAGEMTDEAKKRTDM